MAKFKFKLQKILQHRKTLEDIAQRDLEEAAAELRQRETLLTQYVQSIVSARDEASRMQQLGGSLGAGLMQIDGFIKGQEVRIQRQKEQIKEQASLVENLREILRQKAIDYKIMEELREKKKKEFFEEQEKLEQKEIDDLNSMRFQRGS